MDSWDEIRTAYQVARAGTVSGAAEALGVHHATVIRHIDSIEARLGVKLFQRHARGYTATEAGADLLRVAQATDEQFSQLSGRIKGLGEGVAGDLVVTSLSVCSRIMSQIMTEFQNKNPGVVVRYKAGKRILRLEYGEAHVALRVGRAPTEPDNVVQRLGEMRLAMVGSADYLREHGHPKSDGDFARHRYVGTDEDGGPAPFNDMIEKLAGPGRVTFRVSEENHMIDAIRAGAGLGFVGGWELASEPTLVEIDPARAATTSVWIVTHVDLHRTAKVQAFVSHLKERSAVWEG